MSRGGEKVLTLDFSKRPNDCGTGTYESNGTEFTVTKDTTDVPGIFFKLVHTTSETPFKLETNLVDGQTITKTVGNLSEPISEVNKVSVYYWNREDNNPILLEIEYKGIKRYFHRQGGKEDNWSPAGNSDKELVHLLDDNNCRRNQAVPFDIQNPTTAYSSYKSYCISNTREIIESDSKVNIPGYTVREYKINNNDTGFPGVFGIGAKISRVTYGGKNTNINLPKGYAVYKIRVYSHGPTSIPLMLQFVNKDETEESKWFYSQIPGGTQWGSAGKEKSQKFYKGDEPTEKLTTELDDVRCLRDNEVTMNLSLSNSKIHAKGGNKYCCEKHISDKKVTVTSQPVSFNRLSIPCYKHHIDDRTMLSGIKYYDGNTRKSIKLQGHEFPIKGSLSVYILYCGKDPKLIYVKEGNRSVNKWFKKGSSDDSSWEETLKDLTKGQDDPDNIKDCPNWTRLNDLLESLQCQNFGHCSQGSGGTTTVHVSYGDGSSPSHSSQSQVTINLNIKPGGDHGTKTYPSSTGGREIKVILTIEPPNSDFLKYEHKDSNGTPFTLKAVLDDHNTPIPAISQLKGQEVTSVSAYYWKHDNDTQTPSKTLLVEVVTIKGNTIRHIYYANSNYTGWNLYNPTQSTSKLNNVILSNKLEMVNCDINNVVQINLLKTDLHGHGTYCHDSIDVKDIHIQKRVRVTNITGDAVGKLGMYRAYSHTPSSGTFLISSFNKGGTVIQLQGLKLLPLRDTTKVIVYFCREDIGGATESAKNPLLIYVLDSQDDHKWFRKHSSNDSNEWIEVDSLPSTENDYSKIVDFLDTLDSTCKPPLVAIEIDQRGNHSGSKRTYLSYSKYNIEVQGTTASGAFGFTEYTHKVESWYTYFTVSGFKYNGGYITGGLNERVVKNVTSVSVYYWSALEDTQDDRERNKPLLVKVVTQDPSTRVEKSTYYENKGDKGNLNWQSTDIILENLRSKLQLLNCRLNKAVVIDVRKNQNSTTYDACDRKDLDSNHYKEKMRVNQDEEDTKELQKYQVYKHILKDPLGHKFHIVSFKDFNGLPTSPILNVDEVKVYMCEQEKMPLLIYVKATSISRKWFKKSESGNLEKVPITNTSLLSPISYDAILTELDKLTSKCQPPSVTIDISKKDESTGYKSSDIPPENIKVIKQTNPQGTPESDPPEHYNLYEHKAASRPRSYFTLSGLVYDGSQNKISAISTMENVTSVSVYYWSYLPKEGRPLLLKIVQTTSKTNVNSDKVTWFENTGIDDGNLNWGPTSVDTANMETKLDLMNCRLNFVVKINVGMKPGDDTYGAKKEYDSCEDPDHTSSGGRLKVTNVTPGENQLSNYKAYEHSSPSRQLFHIVGFYDTKGSVGITLNNKGTNSQPILNVQKFIVYVCQQEPEKPILIYYTNGSTHNWYQIKNPASGDGTWKISVGLTTRVTDDKYGDILQVLNGLPSKCKPDVPTRERIVGVVGAAATGIAGYAFSGTLAGTGLVSLVGYKLVQRYKGDPWVRQI